MFEVLKVQGKYKQNLNSKISTLRFGKKVRTPYLFEEFVCRIVQNFLNV